MVSGQCPNSSIRHNGMRQEHKSADRSPVNAAFHGFLPVTGIGNPGSCDIASEDKDRNRYYTEVSTEFQIFVA